MPSQIDVVMQLMVFCSQHVRGAPLLVSARRVTLFYGAEILLTNEMADATWPIRPVYSPAACELIQPTRYVSK